MALAMPPQRWRTASAAWASPAAAAANGSARCRAGGHIRVSPEPDALVSRHPVWPQRQGTGAAKGR